MDEFRSTHNLAFEIGRWEDDDFVRFRVGTCKGLWRHSESEYEIVAIANTEPGNGHLTDTLEWFENSCRRDKKHLVISEMWNERFKKHLIEKRGFEAYKENKVIKYFWGDED